MDPTPSDPQPNARPPVPLDREHGEAWPVDCWGELADRGPRRGLSMPVVAFFRLLGELRRPGRLRIAAAKMTYLHDEHLAAATGHLAGFLLQVQCRDVPDHAVPHLRSVHDLLCREMEDRARRQGGVAEATG